ncbi:enterotoxin A family protein [Paraburkholderia aromaticivorans]|nr:enterotoxin A family protein [Paraburkholderia aromaticivorans]
MKVSTVNQSPASGFPAGEDLSTAARGCAAPSPRAPSRDDLLRERASEAMRSPGIFGNAHAGVTRTQPGYSRAVKGTSANASKPASGPPPSGRIERSPMPQTPQPPAAPDQVQYNGHAITLRPPVAAPRDIQTTALQANVFNILYRPAINDDPQTLPGACREALCAGAVLHVERLAAGGGSTLLSAAAGVRDQLRSGGQARDAAMSEIERAHQQFLRFSQPVELPNRIRHYGSGNEATRNGFSADALIDDLRRNFGSPFMVRTSAGDIQQRPNDFANLNLYYQLRPDRYGRTYVPGGIDGHVVGIQRLMRDPDYRNDRYQVTESNSGTFEYANFDQMAYALTDFYNNGYREVATGIVAFSTSYYFPAQAHGSAQNPHDIGGYALEDLPLDLSAGAQPPGQQPTQQEPLDLSVPRMPYVSLTPPRVDLPPPPEPHSSRYRGGDPYSDLKRSTDGEPLDPIVLYRPSQVTPDQMKKQGGFSAEGTRLQNVNLSTHNGDVAFGRGVTDGAGYLGAFRKLDTAAHSLQFAGGAKGYIYDVAPTPNMIDVGATLGERTHKPEDGEVAALGRIDNTQIRGWRSVADGKVGDFVANPDYRWDVYDQTHIAGAQPQLSGFAPDDPAWGDANRRPFVEARPAAGRTVYATHEDPNLATARFYAHAKEKIRSLERGESYLGPVSIRAKDDWFDGAFGTLAAGAIFRSDGSTSFTGPDDSYVGVTSPKRAKPDFGNLELAPDGRLQFTGDMLRGNVVRVGSNGRLYVDRRPVDANDQNGVFRYDNQSRLVHVPDGKWLTYGSDGHAYLTDDATPSPFEALKTKWGMVDPAGRHVTPPLSPSAFKDTDAGGASTLYRFERDPDSALPPEATYFVTDVPILSRYDTLGSWLDGVNDQSSSAPGSLAKWLSDRNAAWLFPEGYYVFAPAPDRLEVRNLEGASKATLKLKSPGGPFVRTDAQPIHPDYRIPQSIWKRLEDYTQTRQRLSELTAPTRRAGG